VAADLSPTLRLGTPAPVRNRRFHTDFGRLRLARSLQQQ
jgi:hypothetical protein